MALLGDYHPELAQKLGLDPAKLRRSDYARLIVVTFQAPKTTSGPRRDPIAWLPPEFNVLRNNVSVPTYGVVDREHVKRVKPGEVWIVRPYQGPSAAHFLVPLVPVDLNALLGLLPEMREDLITSLIAAQPSLVSAFVTSATAKPKPDGGELAALRAKYEALQDRVRAFAERSKADLATLLEGEPTAVPVEASPVVAAPAPAAPPLVELKAKPRTGLPVFLVDASVLINARRWGWESCNRIIDSAGQRFNLAMTREVYDELHHHYRLPEQGVIILEPSTSTDAANAETFRLLEEVAEANKTHLGKRASKNDLTLLRALVEHREIRGVIVEDKDLHCIHPQSIIRKAQNGREVECLTSEQFLERHKKLVA